MSLSRPIDIGRMAPMELVVRQAEQGNAEALFELGLCYANGLGVPQDFVAAHRCFNLAARNGLIEAVAYRAEIARDMNPDEIAEAQRQAREWIAQRAH